ncbi:MAG TPA: acyltransferase [Clostridia bacterium]|nr:acyltransferase [Clostridia bacterium]
MLFQKVFSILKLGFLRLRFGKRLKIRSIRHNFKADTEIAIGKNAVLTLGRVSFRTNVHILCDCGSMDIGSHVVFNRNCIIACRQRIVIGDRCLFGPNVCVYDHDHIYSSNGVSPTEFKCSEVIIEDGCWIGAGAIILSGTHIGRNSVIEAGAVIRGNIPAGSLVAVVREMRIIPAALFAGRHKKPEES